jgi:transcriptional regulator with XRE-family HTH domain
MATEDRKNLGKMLKQRRVMMSLTLHELARAASVSASHLGRIERGERFPSARILRRLAKPLGLEEVELHSMAGYLSQQAPAESEPADVGRLDPYVASVMCREPVHVQRAVLTVLMVMKSMARWNDCSSIPLDEYLRHRYPEVDEDTIATVRNLLESPAKSNVNARSC